MIIDFVVLLQFGLTFDGWRGVGDDLGRVGFAGNKGAAFKAAKARMALVDGQNFQRGQVCLRCRLGRVVSP